MPYPLYKKKILQGFAGGEYQCAEKILNINVTIDGQYFNAELFVIDDNTTSYEVIIGLNILSNGRVIIENGNCQVYAIHTIKEKNGQYVDEVLVAPRTFEVGIRFLEELMVAIQ